jgi:hypothetical protein
MWEYTTVSLKPGSFDALGELLNNWGRVGWEAVGISPIDWLSRENHMAEPVIGILLKRRINPS